VPVNLCWSDNQLGIDCCNSPIRLKTIAAFLHLDLKFNYCNSIIGFKLNCCSALIRLKFNCGNFIIRLKFNGCKSLLTRLKLNCCNSLISLIRLKSIAVTFHQIEMKTPPVPTSATPVSSSFFTWSITSASSLCFHSNALSPNQASLLLHFPCCNNNEPTSATHLSSCPPQTDAPCFFTFPVVTSPFIWSYSSNTEIPLQICSVINPRSVYSSPILCLAHLTYSNTLLLLQLMEISQALFDFPMLSLSSFCIR
jgi:hypothetical protein